MLHIDDSTKAGRIFKATYYAALDAVEYMHRICEHRIDALYHPATDETMCTRTLNAIDKMIDKAYKQLAFDCQFSDDQTYINDYDALNITRNTFNNYRARLQELKQY